MGNQTNQDFIQAVIKELEAQNPGQHFTQVEVAKINGIKQGIQLEDNTELKSVVYPETLLAKNPYLSVRETAEIAYRMLIEGQENNSDVSGFSDQLCKWETVKGLLKLRLINTEKNSELFRWGAISRPVANDLSMVVYATVKMEDTSNFASSVVNERLLDLWGITADDCFNAAMENSDPDIQSLGEMLKMIMPEPMIAEAQGCPSLYVLTNKDKMYGAGDALAGLKQLADEMKSDLYVLPSSVHELLAMKYTNEEAADELAGIIRAVNESQVAPEELLSDHPYIYSRESNSLKAA